MGDFREDLFHRLNESFVCHIPSLRERREEHSETGTALAPGLRTQPKS